MAVNNYNEAIYQGVVEILLTILNGENRLNNAITFVVMLPLIMGLIILYMGIYKIYDIAH